MVRVSKLDEARVDAMRGIAIPALVFKGAAF
jgi:hypothetical protein